MERALEEALCGELDSWTCLKMHEQFKNSLKKITFRVIKARNLRKLIPPTIRQH